MWNWHVREMSTRVVCFSQSRNNASPPTSSAPQAEVPFAPSFVAPLPIPGIRRAPRTPTLPADSKFVKYVSIFFRNGPFRVADAKAVLWMLDMEARLT